MPKTVQMSAVIPTRNRHEVLGRTLTSLAEQSVQPEELIIIDASDDELPPQKPDGLLTKINWQRAKTRGAASQRNEAAPHCTTDAIIFLDDDILFEPECLERMWNAFQRDPKLGGINAMITNCKYSAPGPLSKRVFDFLNGSDDNSYAGKIFGPAVAMLPDDRPELPDTVEVEWMNLGCTLYRREALPNPWLASHFEGYSLFEDVTLSLNVRLKNGWKIANARTARIYHDSQPGDHKSSAFVVSRMEVLNRHYVMTAFLGRNSAGDFFRMLAFHSFKLASLIRTPANWLKIPPSLAGILHAAWTITRKSPQIS